MKKVVAVDVDLTVVNSAKEWARWYFNLTGHDLGEISSENNDIETLMKNHNDPMEFWRKPDLYDNMEPIPESVVFLDKIVELGIDVVFVSACYPSHENSKRLFLKRNFKFEHGFISTSDKHFVRCDYFIDDYKKYCRQMVGKAKVFQIVSDINSSSDGEFPYVGWEEIYEAIKEDFKEDFKE